MARRKLYARGFDRNRGHVDGRHGLVTCPRCGRLARIGRGQWMCSACADRDRASRLEREGTAHRAEDRGTGNGTTEKRGGVVARLMGIVARFLAMVARVPPPFGSCDKPFTPSRTTGKVSRR